MFELEKAVHKLFSSERYTAISGVCGHTELFNKSATPKVLNVLKAIGVKPKKGISFKEKSKQGMSSLQRRLHEEMLSINCSLKEEKSALLQKISEVKAEIDASKARTLELTHAIDFSYAHRQYSAAA